MNENILEKLTENEMKVLGSMNILDKYGKHYAVNNLKDKRLRRKIGNCYENTIRKMDDGLKYVEGYAQHKVTGLKIHHSWNIDSEHNCYDFTLPNPDDYIYFGVVVPEKLLYAVGAEQGFVWYACLPKVDIERFEKYI